MQRLTASGHNHSLYLECLRGQARVFRNGTQIQLSRKQILLLRYLARQTLKAEIDADTVAELLWPSSDRKRSRHSLRQALSEIGKSLQELAPHIVSGRVVLQWERLTTDVQLFESAARNLEYETAFELYTDRLPIEDLGSGEFLEWQELERDRIHALFSHAAKRAMEAAAARAEWPIAEKYASSLLRFDRDESAIEAWLTAIVLQGDHERARSEATQIRLDYQDDLSPECIAYLKRIETAAPPAVQIRGAGFVGRQPELSHLIQAWTGTCNVMVLHGGGGIGKTALAHQFLRYAALQGAACITLVCDRHRRHIPYATILDLIQSTPARIAQALSPDQEMLLRDLAAGMFPERVPDGTSRSTADQVGAVLEQILSSDSLRPRTIFFVDDAQYADASSLEALVEYYRDAGTTAALLLLATRSDDSPAKWSARFGRSSESIQLERLDPDAVHTYIAEFEARNRLSFTPQDRATIEKIAGGEPFYLESLVGSMVTQGRVQELRTAGRLKELVQQRLEPLTDQALSVLGVLSCAGRPLSLDAIVFASSISEVSVLRAVEQLIAARLVEEVRNQLGVTHELIAEMVIELSTRIRNRLYHSRLADHFMRVEAPDHVFLAYHCEQADRREEAFQYLIAAAAKAEAFVAVTETESLLRRALSVATHSEARREARRKLAHLYLRVARLAECIELVHGFEEFDPELRLARLLSELRTVDDGQIDARALDELIQITDQISDNEVRVVALNMFLVQAYGRGDGDLLRNLIEFMNRLLLESNAAEQARIMAAVTQVFPLVGHSSNDLRLDYVELESRNWRLRAKVMEAQGRELLLSGKPADACEVFDQAWELLKQHDATELFVGIFANHGLALWQKGDFAAAEVAFSSGAEMCLRFGDAGGARFCTANLAALRFDLGDVAHARALASGLLAENGARLVLQLAASSVLGLCAIAEEDMEAAAAAKAVLDEHREQAELLFMGAHPTLFLARYALLTEGREIATAILAESIEREQDRDVPAAMALRLERARIISEDDRATAAEELAAVERLCREQGLHEHDARIRELHTLLDAPLP